MYHITKRLTSYFVHRERKEREEAEREGRPIQEEEPDDENMPSPFQPIGNLISEVCRCCVPTTQAGVLYCLRVLVGFEIIVYFKRLRKDSFWLSCFFQNEDKEKERKRPRELQEGRTNSPKADGDQEEEEYEEDNDEEPDDTRQTPENTSSGE